MKSIQEYYALLERKWPCDAREYPMVGRLSDPADLLAFKLHRALGHVHKSTGRMEALLEPVDHGEPVDSLKTDQMVELIGKSFVNLLHIAEVLKIEPEKIEGWLEEFFRDVDQDA